MVSIEKQTNKNLIPFSELDTPADLVLAYNYALFILNLKRNLPEEYYPKKWQLYFEDEIEKCIRRYYDSFKIKGKDSSKTFEEAASEVKYNVLAEDFKKKFLERS